MMVHIKIELQCICYSISPFRRLSTSRKNFACAGSTFPLHNGKGFFLDGAMSCKSVWPLVFRLTTIQCIVATQNGIVTKVTYNYP